MLGLIRLASVCFGLLLAVPAAAQDPAAVSSPDGDAARVLAELLQDDAAREALIARLLVVADGADAQIPPAEAEPQTSLARRIADYTSDVAEEVTSFVFALGNTFGEIRQAFTGEGAMEWSDLRAALVSLLAVIVVTLALFFTLRALGQRVFRAMAERPDNAAGLRSLLRLAGASLVDAGIILVAWGGGYAFALLFGETGSMDVRQSLFLNAFLLVEMAKVVMRAVFSPNFGKLRFAAMSDETAGYWYFWTSRLTSLLGYGLLLVVPIINEMVSFTVGRSLAVLIGLTALLVATLIILQNRAPIRKALTARRERDPKDMLGRVEAVLGVVWHWLAIAYLTGFFLVWAARPGDALQFILVATVNSAIAIVVGVVVTVLISRAIAGGMKLPAEVRRTLPLLEDRLNLFVPTILKTVRIVVALAVLVTIAQAWQLMDFIGLLASEVGREVTGRVISAAVIVLVSVLIWLAVSSFVEYRLNPELGAPTARERTLLALFRNAFMVALVIIGAMLALSELGVNIAPLLAGAGVLGLAIGFGAQRLVQDIITGAFIQFENAMNEGDVVTAGGTTGVVERMTIRSVGLRDTSGTYHIIPFSSVDRVANFMKGFAYHVAEISVAYRENVSEVKELMRKASNILKDGPLGEHVLEPIDIQGVSSLSDSAVVVRGRIKTTPGRQWAIGRAYNEIIKEVLDEAGVEIPFPHVTLYMGQGKDGTAPPLNLRRIDKQPRPDGEPGGTDAPGPGTTAEPKRERADEPQGSTDLTAVLPTQDEMDPPDRG